MEELLPFGESLSVWCYSCFAGTWEENPECALVKTRRVGGKALGPSLVSQPSSSS